MHLAVAPTQKNYYMLLLARIPSSQLIYDIVRQCILSGGKNFLHKYNAGQVADFMPFFTLLLTRRWYRAIADLPQMTACTDLRSWVP